MNNKPKKKLTYGDVYRASGDFIIGNKRVIEELNKVMKNEKEK